MDWAGTGLNKQLAIWLENTAADRYVRDKRLDPFATSMRDFDDVATSLQRIRDKSPLGLNDSAQRVTDLRAAGLCANSLTLTDLGSAVISFWEKAGIANSDIGDELARLLAYVFHARQLKEPTVIQFLDYWAELRKSFSALDLIANWDSLYAINYLDFIRGDFAPGNAVRASKISASDVDFDLLDFAVEQRLGDDAVRGAERIAGALGSKIPRGRHRATFCMALEIMLSGGTSTQIIIDRCGIPIKPRVWTKFSEDQQRKIKSVLLELNLTDIDTVQIEIDSTVSVQTEVGVEEEAVELKLPANIDFSKVLVGPPKSKSKSAQLEVQRTSRGKIIDYQKRSRDNDVVGNLGEEFALAYERWRLRERPHLSAKIKHVAATDDTLGYDIESFELDGTPRFVEVKGTLGELDNRFFVSRNELECAKRLGAKYVLLRVARLCDQPICHEMRFPFDDEITLNPEIYVALFK